jgi:putative DNA-invertase from lambdoid prophage Rac
MRIAYYRVSTGDQSIEAQRTALGGDFGKEFEDVGVSGGVMAAERPGFGKLLEQIRQGDTLCVYAVDRLGRDALDVQSTVRRLIQAGVTVDIHGLGQIGRGVGEIILAVLAQVADMERHKIKERTEAGRAAARKALEATGKTHRGKDSLGRPRAADASAVEAWRIDNQASIQQTARHFGLSLATVKRYRSAAAKPDVADPLNLPEPAVQSPVALVDPLAERLALLKAEHGPPLADGDPLLTAPLP